MNDYRGGGAFCYFHPKEKVVGVCPFCLNERLLILASKEGHISSAKRSRRKPHINLPKFFAFGSLLSRLDFRNSKYPEDDDFAFTSREDSFISIKFEDNGVASWEKGTVPKVSLEHCNLPWNHTSSKGPKPEESKSVVEHSKPPVPLRWQKRIDQVFQLIRWKKSGKATVCHVGSQVEGVKVRKSWIRNLTERRRTRE